MNTRSVPALVLTVVLCLPLAGQSTDRGERGGEGPSVTPPAKADSIPWTNDADTDWTLLVQDSRSVHVPQVSPGNARSAAPGGFQATPSAGFQRQADNAAAFRNRHPDHPKVAEARRMEALALFQVILSGDESVSSRAETVAHEAITDQRLSEQVRYEVASQAEMVRQRRHFGSPANLKAERTASARRLMTQFPRHPGGYKALLDAVEHETDPAKVLAVAEELLAPDVPRSVRREAQMVKDRTELPGEELGIMLQGALGSDEALKALRGRITVLYTWSDTSPGSWLQARELMILAAEKVGYLGLYVGQADEAVKEIVAREEMPGAQLPGSWVQRKSLARALGVSGAFPIYVIDREGRVAFVTQDLAGLPERVRELSNK